MGGIVPSFRRHGSGNTRNNKLLLTLCFFCPVVTSLGPCVRVCVVMRLGQVAWWPVYYLLHYTPAQLFLEIEHLPLHWIYGVYPPCNIKNNPVQAWSLKERRVTWTCVTGKFIILLQLALAPFSAIMQKSAGTIFYTQSPVLKLCKRRKSMV